MTAASRVLVTRPEGQAGGLCEALEAAGFESFHQPLLELEALPELDARQRALLLDLDLFSHVLFVSGNAVRYGMNWIEDYWPQLPVGLTWYAVGAVTAAALAGHGVPVQSPSGNMSSEGLLALPTLQSVAGQRVLIVKGEGGRDTLRRELEGRGARVSELACYRRRCPELPPGVLAARLSDWRVDTVCISSGEGLANMLRLLSPAETLNLRSINLLVPSGRVARQAGAAGFTRVITADNASDTAMLRALGGLCPGFGEK